jgi:L-amino acid N-acyltransferase YncA
MSYSFEAMSDQHRRPVVDIFNHFVAHSFAAYPEQPISDEIFDRFRNMASGYPSLVIKDHSGQVVGFAFLHPYHSASSLRRAAEVTYFIMPEHTRQGLGTAILARFVAQAPALGVDTILASISSQNEGSIRLHRKNGFHECGRFVRAGRKFGQDFDIVWMQRHLSSPRSEGVGSGGGIDRDTDGGGPAAGL